MTWWPSCIIFWDSCDAGGLFKALWKWRCRIRSCPSFFILLFTVWLLNQKLLTRLKTQACTLAHIHRHARQTVTAKSHKQSHKRKTWIGSDFLAHTHIHTGCCNRQDSHPHCVIRSKDKKLLFVLLHSSVWWVGPLLVWQSCHQLAGSDLHSEPRRSVTVNWSRHLG